MQFFLFSIFAIIFCFINYKIIISDQKTKKIPNKHLLQLLFLLPFWYIFLYFFPIGDFEILGFIFQIFLSFLISFLLFHFGIWRAGDAKYLLVLSLFIPYIGIIPFIGNLGLLTLFYLFLYFLWFFIGKSLIHKGYFKNLIYIIHNSLLYQWNFFKRSKGGNIFINIFWWIFTFLLIFVSIRLARIYIFSEILENKSNSIVFQDFFEQYHFYIIFGSIGIFIIGLYFFQKSVTFLKKFFEKIFHINASIIGKIFLGILFSILIAGIIFEYFHHPEEISVYLFRIFTIYIAIYIFVKIIWQAYKMSFMSAEGKIIHLKDLNENHIIDMNWLEKIFHFRNQKGEEGFKKLYDDAIEGKKVNIENLKKLLRASNNYDKRIKINQEYKPITSVVVMNTFAFSPYIFVGFLLTFIFQNHIIHFITKNILQFIYQ